MDNTIDKSIQMDSQMKEFFECISGDADTQQQRIQCIRNGLAAIADRLRLGKAEITVDIPKNRFYAAWRKKQRGIIRGRRG